MEEGKFYYVEGLFKEQTYADFFGIGVVLPDGRNETPIASHHFMREALPESTFDLWLILYNLADGNL